VSGVLSAAGLEGAWRFRELGLVGVVNIVVDRSCVLER
jgi:hypothetical protein